ncbi:MAG: hypothetical protein R3236_00300 [Phycisphaeraceae bacterium]|nr:hypothetical protein [Phycisphaeraceae bacterium]
MAERPEKPISANRRGFFRQIFVSAIETVEKVGREMADRLEIDEPIDPFRDVDFNWNWPELDDPGFGPPHPAPLGPPIPVSIRKKLRQLHGPTVARSPGQPWADDSTDSDAS